MLQARELNTQKQQELLLKRVSAIQEVLAAARPLVRALKAERKARVREAHEQRAAAGGAVLLLWVLLCGWVWWGVGGSPLVVS